jgi:hypothetical protein
MLGIIRGGKRLGSEHKNSLMELQGNLAGLSCLYTLIQVTLVSDFERV